MRQRGVRSKALFGESRADAAQAIEEYTARQLDALVMTRQLFGRGFDLPMADAAIFYSPKNDHRVMWQEMLRIRGTIRCVKNVYVLFFAWTSESLKMRRFVRGMEASGGRFDGGGYFWAYSEMSEFEDVPDVGEDWEDEAVAPEKDPGTSTGEEEDRKAMLADLHQ